MKKATLINKYLSVEATSKYRAEEEVFFVSGKQITSCRIKRITLESISTNGKVVDKIHFKYFMEFGGTLNEDEIFSSKAELIKSL